MFRINKKRFYIAISICLVLIALSEFILRYVFGFCDAVLYQSSPAYEYIAQPNQHRYRFFSHIDYNSYSQRSEEPDSTKTIVLGLGDSVIFGGTMLDQDSIATTLFSKETGMQMLNISSGSWGPDNCAVYLKEKGTFGAKAMVLVCSSHDAFDVMSHIPVVGIYPNYPDKQYKLAIWEVIDRYLMPRIKVYFRGKQLLDPDAQVVEKVKSDEGVAKKALNFDPGFDQLLQISEEKHIPFFIYLHPEVGEVMSRKYKEGGLMIMEWAKTHHIKLIDGLNEGVTVDMYRDVIHLNEKGQRNLANSLKKMINR
ncbi:hypothetical protein [Segatella hominis]|uniref:hypothetical protein n=1 Tax=Segatella hominis TaxID=2518605 RepID=UPI003AAE36C0